MAAYPGTNELKLSKPTVEKILADYLADLLSDSECRIISVTPANAYSQDAGSITVEFTSDPLPQVVG
jgi:hypothetical protein